MTPTSSPDQSRFAELQKRVYSRISVLHYAHAAVSGLIAVIIAGAAAKMAWDYTLDEMPWTLGVIGVAAALVIYSLVRFLFGRRAMKFELGLFEELQSLRTRLGYDQPSSLLPQ